MNSNSRSNSGYSNSRSGSRVGQDGNRVSVSNIDFNCSHIDLKDAFKKVGEVAFVEMIKDDNQKSKGCAIIRFKQNNIADEAIRIMNRYELNGRKIIVKDYSQEWDAPRDKNNIRMKKRPRDDEMYDRNRSRPSSNSNVSDYGNTYGLSVAFLQSLGIEGPLGSRVFAANLDYGINEEMLRDVFSIAGKVVDIELVKDEDGKSKGYGFIDFEHPIEAVQAISMLHNQSYRDRQMSVQLTRKERKKKEAAMKLPSGLRSIGMGLGVNGAPLKEVRATVESGNPNGLMGVMPTTNQNMNPSLAMNNLDIGGGLSSNLALNNCLGGGVSLGGNMGRGLMDQPMGLSLGLTNASSNLRNFGNQSNQQNFGNSFTSPSLTNSRNCIQISNLPNDYTWKDLQKLCSTFGDINFSKVTGRGTGAVQFENEVAARRAVDMLDGQRFEGTYLESRLL